MVLLSLAGVGVADIVEDYRASDGDRVVALRAALGMRDDTTGIEAIYQRVGTTSVDAIAESCNHSIRCRCCSAEVSPTPRWIERADVW